jgi:hypothetical protein
MKWFAANASAAIAPTTTSSSTVSRPMRRD